MYKRQAYAEAQKQVQLSTSISVKANAQASAAREKADKAAMEKADAATAAQMAQKLKSDATVARVNTDEAVSYTHLDVYKRQAQERSIHKYR